MKNALMIDYYLCTGCHSCEVACKYEKNIADGKWGIKINEETPFKLDEKHWEFKFVPVPSSLCDGCAERVDRGKQPACVHNCQARCMEFGAIDQIAARATEIDRRVAIYVI